MNRGRKRDSLDLVYDALGTERRRRVLSCLADHDGPLQLGELAAEIAAMETDERGTEPSSDATERVCLSLYHQALPKLAAADLVHHDQDAGTVSLNANPLEENQKRELVEKALQA